MASVADSGLSLPKKKSLLDKLDVPVHHLDFDFVKKCTDVKELEKIIKILRSKQEGHYPELEACAENQLAALDSRHRLLRTTTKVMTKADLSKEEWNNITSDLLNWKGGVENKDLEIFEAKSRTPNGTLPNVRNSSKGFRNSKPSGSKAEKSQRISSLDYKSWDKFDADEECKKMDLEEEQKQAAENRASDDAARTEMSESAEELAVMSLGDISCLSSNEREVMAAREKDIGNELYHAHQLDGAIAHYTRSIHLSPTIASLNNRAVAYLKECAFNKALHDLNRVLDMDPTNVKARYRRALTFQHKNMFQEALEDINVVLSKEPNHLVAEHLADQLRESVSKLPRMHRIRIKDKETGKTVIKKVTEEAMLSEYKDQDFIEVNDWGLPRIMCNCNGKHSSDPGIRHEHHMRYQHLKSNAPLKKSEKAEAVKPDRYAPIALPADKVQVLEEAKGLEVEKHLGKRLQILEVEKGSLETENGRKDLENACTVADMRTVRSANPDSSNVEIVVSENGEKSENFEAIGAPRGNTEKNDEPVDGPHRIENEKSPGKRDLSPKTKTNNKSGKSVNEKPQKTRDLSPSVGDDKFQKTNKNSLIKDISSSSHSSRTGATDPESSPDLVKGVKTDKNSRIQDNRIANGHDGRTMESAARQPCGCAEVFNKFQFKKEWAAFSGSKSLERKAELLKSICPKHLVDAFGNSWEKEMLVDVFECLRHHFSPSEQLRVAEYLKVVPKLDRFKINAMFLSSEEKSLARELVKKCGPLLDSSTVNAFS